MGINNILLVSFSLLLFNSSSLKNTESTEVKHQDKIFNIQSPNEITYDSLKAKYDTLIPIFDGLFVTYHKIDSINYFKYAKKNVKNSIEINYSEEIITSDTKKWGVIDSLGNVVVPFICDGVRQISENNGVVSVYSASGSLHTGIPRYEYVGKLYFFNKKGLIPETVENYFTIIIEYIADNHNSAYVIQQGPAFYLPNEYRSGIRY